VKSCGNQCRCSRTTLKIIRKTQHVFRARGVYKPPLHCVLITSPSHTSLFFIPKTTQTMLMSASLFQKSNYSNTMLSAGLVALYHTILVSRSVAESCCIQSRCRRRTLKNRINYVYVLVRSALRYVQHSSVYKYPCRSLGLLHHTFSLLFQKSYLRTS
jgi:hypothetical protein